MNNDVRWMQRALELARRGEGSVEPNPLVGCVIVRDEQVLGEGWHQTFGGPHAEVEALNDCSTDPAEATFYVTLEPCCHHGKTPPCTEALIKAAPGRVVVAARDPFPQVAGGGVQQLRDAGLAVEVGVLEDDSREMMSPYLKLVEQGLPWIIAKWAMTLDGKIATVTGSSRWISNESARARVHQLRGRMDAIMVGANTARLDDPLLTARPPGPRLATRVVIDSSAGLSDKSQMARTAQDAPLLLFAGPTAPADRVENLRQLGCEVIVDESESPSQRLSSALQELGRRRFTNVLVEGGSHLWGSLFEMGQIDEIHAFIAPKIVGGSTAPTPVGGVGIAAMPEAAALRDIQIEQLEDNLYVRGRLRSS